MVENDELEVVEEMVAEALVDDRVGVIVATEECVVLSVDATHGDAEIEVVGIVEIAAAPASFGIVRAVSKVVADEIGIPNKLLENAVVVLIADEGVTILVRETRRDIVRNKSQDVADEHLFLVRLRLNMK